MPKAETSSSENTQIRLDPAAPIKHSLSPCHKLLVFSQNVGTQQLSLLNNKSTIKFPFFLSIGTLRLQCTPEKLRGERKKKKTQTRKTQISTVHILISNQLGIIKRNKNTVVSRGAAKPFPAFSGKVLFGWLGKQYASHQCSLALSCSGITETPTQQGG